MHTTSTFGDPVELAQKSSQQIISAIDSNEDNKAKTENMLTALQIHYDTIQKSQEMYIEYLTEFISKLRETQHKDKETLANLKKQVLHHVLSLDKTS